jgi:integrase
VYDAFYAICVTANIEGVRPHDLRRSLISFGIEDADVPLDSMAKTIGHADANTTRRHYHRVSAEKRRENMEKTTRLYMEDVAK